LISLRPEQKDTNCTWEEFERKVNTELNDVVGNFVHRTTSFIQTYYKGKVPKYSPTNEQHAKILASLSHSLPNVDERLGHFRLKDALEQVVELAREGNRYLNEHEPWRLYKTDAQAAGETLGVSIQIVATLGILLQPFLPSTSKKICLSLMGKASLPWQSAGQTIVKPGARIRPLQPLFHKVTAEKLRAGLEDIRSRAPVEAEA
jgi:methionyl-tRNA synthetase